jgi:hypothetical protein
MTASPGGFTISITRPTFRALVITCALAQREIDVYAEALPDSPNYDWSIILDRPLYWVRPARTALTDAEAAALTTALVQRADTDGLRVRWE